MLVLVSCAWCTGPSRVRAEVSELQPAPQRAADLEPSRARTFGLGALGFVTGFLSHEAGHLAANLALGNVPRLEGFLVWGFVPFFSIAPGIRCEGEACVTRDGSRFAAGRRGKYFIVSAGFHVQHLTDELLLSLDPELRFRDSPLQKGLLLFNVFLSTMYVVGEWTGLSDPHGDLGGMRQMSGYDGRLLSLSLLAPAVLDAYRFFYPGSAGWSAWAARGAKAAFLGLNFTF